MSKRLVVVSISHNQRIGYQPEKNYFLHGGQSRSRSAEQGKQNQKRSLVAHPLPHPPTARSEKKNNKKNPDASTGATQVSVGLASIQGFLRIVD